MADYSQMRRAFSRRRHPLAWLTAILAAFAGLGVLYFLAAVSVAEVLRPMYDPVQRTISELAVGRYGYLQISAFVALGLSFVALSLGLWQRVRATVTSRLGLVLILVCAASTFVAAAFPTDLRTAAVATVSGQIHAISASVGYGCLITAMLLLSWHFRRDLPWRTLHFPASGLTLVGLAALLTMAVTGSSSIAGLLQRIMTVALLSWVALTALHVGRLSLAPRPARVHEPRD